MRQKRRRKTTMAEIEKMMRKIRESIATKKRRDQAL